MPNEIDKSILDRLQALRSGSPSASPPPTRLLDTHIGKWRVNIDLIQRNKTPTREDSLAARLKSLRIQDEEASAASPSSTRAQLSTPQSSPAPASEITYDKDGDDVDAAFQTDDQTLEELLGDIGDGYDFTAPDDDDKVRALLDELEDSIPHDDADKEKHGSESDDSDEDIMKREIDDVIARLRDELQVQGDDDPQEQDANITPSDSALDLPSVPDAAASPGPTSMDDMAARLSALRTSSPLGGDMQLPSVPTSRPIKEPKRLKSRKGYTDDDVDSWCTVCLDDATLLCLGCENEDETKDGDPYCARCWREMHVGPASTFDDRSHRAVQINRARKKDKERVALSAS
ncbi:hypothetical protein GMORB2_3651 [Geosmithia morbida]|uniref:Uncharacterized protein n=1 Tax=Geosmithia morbida TaxID=1094350 RepID=A0A9P4YYF9_9HYPO|nr:uncharacterized protein GMORB2_3651 [Geosmithia morbida]KAF4124812.1 hypothetical protein GMORB2_3651 [Geosmithia morbida]